MLFCLLFSRLFVLIVAAPECFFVLSAWQQLPGFRNLFARNVVVGSSDQIQFVPPVYTIPCRCSKFERPFYLLSLCNL
jgi:hypothetical protein